MTSMPCSQLGLLDQHQAVLLIGLLWFGRAASGLLQALLGRTTVLIYLAAHGNGGKNL